MQVRVKILVLHQRVWICTPGAVSSWLRGSGPRALPSLCPMVFVSLHLSAGCGGETISLGGMGNAGHKAGRTWQTWGSGRVPGSLWAHRTRAFK